MGDAFRRREESTWKEIQEAVRSLGHLAWEAFGDRLAFDVDQLSARLPKRIILPIDADESQRALCIGTICEDCCDERYDRRTAKKASSEGISWSCAACGSEIGLLRVYSSSFTDSDLLRVLFPWSGNRGAAST